MNIFEITNLLNQQQTVGKSYLEFLRVPTLSLGLYVLEAGAQDRQQPHTEDEVYYVVSGDGSITIGTQEQAVQAGSVIFVKAHEQHFFHNIKEKLSLLVFFAPAEYSQG